MDNQQARAYEFGDFRLDAWKRLLFDHDGRPLSLTPRAFETLLYLVERSGAVLDKDELIRAVWPDTVVEENNLNQLISTLRRILGDDRARHRYIMTVPGRGYCFVADVITHKPGTDTPDPTGLPTIAVLPFKPLVEAHRDASLELGMADTLIARLSGREVIVRPLSSVRRYVELDQDPLVAGHELGVGSVLEGSIQRWADNIRVTARLISLSTGASLWDGTFDEKFTDIFAVQDAIAEKVANALALQLGYQEALRLTKRYTENVEAYELYLKGRYHVNKLTPPDMQTGITYFQQALEIDPAYALAYVGLANAFLRISIAGEMPSDIFFPKAKEAAQKAIEIDDRLADAHAALGWIIFWYDWDWGAAENQLKRALELNSNNADAHEAYAHLLSNMGRHAEARAEIRRARELDPLNLLTNALEAQFLLHDGKLDEALARLLKTFEVEPNFWLAHLFASSAYTEKGMFAEAIVEAEKARAFSGGSSCAIAYGGYALSKSGKQAEARAVLEELLRLPAERYVPPYHIAVIYHSFGEREETFTWLERGIEQRDPKMTFLKVEPKWNNLRNDPRFQDLLQRVGFEETNK
jgi:DNA-binding winged helix-turn-helix (wHTH) protein/tetratricopeptide (TPR) repeat protein